MILIRCYYLVSVCAHFSGLFFLFCTGLKSDVFSWWESVQSSNLTNLVDKLRWSTLGYHHDWDTKVYSEEKVSTFPIELAELSKLILKQVKGFSELAYQPEAAIVNFYPMDSSIGGHTDHSEPNKAAPLGKFSSEFDPKSSIKSRQGNLSTGGRGCLHVQLSINCRIGCCFTEIYFS